jgi:hypothetical protein
MVVLIVVITLAILLFSARMHGTQLGPKRPFQGFLLLILAIVAVPTAWPLLAFVAALGLPIVLFGLVTFAVAKAGIDLWRKPKKVEVLGCGEHGGPDVKRIPANELHWLAEDAEYAENAGQAGHAGEVIDFRPIPEEEKEKHLG